MAEQRKNAAEALLDLLHHPSKANLPEDPREGPIYTINLTEELLNNLKTLAKNELGLETEKETAQTTQVNAAKG